MCHRPDSGGGVMSEWLDGHSHNIHTSLNGGIMDGYTTSYYKRLYFLVIIRF